MSCRVLKRGMEDVMIDELFRRLETTECETVIGYYYQTKKNAMVENLYEDMGFTLQEAFDGGKRFVIKRKDYRKRNQYIREVKEDEKD